MGLMEEGLRKHRVSGISDHSDPPGRRLHPSFGPGRPTPCPMSRHEFRATGRRLAPVARFRRRPNWQPPWAHASPRSAMSGWRPTGAAQTPPSHAHRQLYQPNGRAFPPTRSSQHRGPSTNHPDEFRSRSCRRRSSAHLTVRRVGGTQRKDRPGPGMRLGGNCDLGPGRSALGNGRLKRF